LVDSKEEVEIPSYFSIKVLKEEKDWKVLKELKTTNTSIFKKNNILFYTLQLDLLNYHDCIKREEEIEVVDKLMKEFGNQLLLESITIQKKNNTEVDFVDRDNFSSFLQKERDSILLSSVQKMLQKDGIQKINIPNQFYNENITEEIVEFYEMNLSPFYHLTKKRRG
jgi:hypothetical protein